MEERKWDLEEKLIEILKILKLEDKRNKFPSQLSGGEQQRVWLWAVCAHRQSFLWLLRTESLYSMDAQFQREDQALQAR